MHKPKEGRGEEEEGKKKSEKSPRLTARGFYPCSWSDLSRARYRGGSRRRRGPSGSGPGRALGAGRRSAEAAARPVALATPPERPASKAAPSCQPARGAPAAPGGGPAGRRKCPAGSAGSPGKGEGGPSSRPPVLDFSGDPAWGEGRGRFSLLFVLN